MQINETDSVKFVQNSMMDSVKFMQISVMDSIKNRADQRDGLEKFVRIDGEELEKSSGPMRQVR